MLSRRRTPAFAPIWSRDGTRLAFDLVRRAQGGDTQEIVAINQVTGTQKSLAVPGSFAFDPTWRR